MKKFAVSILTLAILFSAITQAARESDWARTEESLRCKVTGELKYLCAAIDSANTTEKQRLVLDLINSEAKRALAECNREKVLKGVSPAYYHFIISSNPHDLDQEAAQKDYEMFVIYINECTNFRK